MQQYRRSDYREMRGARREARSRRVDGAAMQQMICRFCRVMLQTVLMPAQELSRSCAAAPARADSAQRCAQLEVWGSDIMPYNISTNVWGRVVREGGKQLGGVHRW